MTWIKTSGIKCAAVTNAPRPNAEMLLGGIRMADEFDLLVIANEEVWWSSASLSFSILTSLSFSLSLLHKAHNKPHPEPYLAAMRKLGLQPEDCVAFEDSPTGATAAVAAGVHTIGILTSQTAEAMAAVGVKQCVGDYHELLREIEAAREK